MFDCPASVLPLLQQNDFSTLDTGMIFDASSAKEGVISADKFHVCTDMKSVDCKGVDAIFDAVGWGARTDEM